MSGGRGRSELGRWRPGRCYDYSTYTGQLPSTRCALHLTTSSQQPAHFCWKLVCSGRRLQAERRRRFYSFIFLAAPLAQLGTTHQAIPGARANIRIYKHFFHFYLSALSADYERIKTWWLFVEPFFLILVQFNSVRLDRDMNLNSQKKHKRSRWC